MSANQQSRNVGHSAEDDERTGDRTDERPGNQSMDSNDDVFDPVGTVDISSISKAILAASNQTGSEDLAELILKMSNKSSSSSVECMGSTGSNRGQNHSPGRSRSKVKSGGQMHDVNRKPDGRSHPEHGGAGLAHKPPVGKTGGSGIPQARSNSRESINKLQTEGKRWQSKENLAQASRIPQPDPSPVEHNGPVQYMDGSSHKEVEKHRRAAEGREGDQHHVLANQRPRDRSKERSRIPTYQGKKSNQKSSGSDTDLQGTGSSDLDNSHFESEAAQVQQGHAAKDLSSKGQSPVRKDQRPLVGKVEPMQSERTNDCFQTSPQQIQDGRLQNAGQSNERSRDSPLWKSPRQSSVFSRSNHDERTQRPLPPLDLQGAIDSTNQDEDMRIIDGLSSSQHERQNQNSAISSHAVSQNAVHPDMHSPTLPPDQPPSSADHVTPRLPHVAQATASDHVTPQENPQVTLLKKNRFSSTPMHPNTGHVNMNVTSSAESALSQITPSPKDRMTYLPDSQDITLFTPDEGVTPNIQAQNKHHFTAAR